MGTSEGSRDVGESQGGSSAVSGMNLVGNYLYRKKKGTVEHWVALRPVFEVCIRETGYEEGGRMRDAWSNKRRQRHSAV